MPALILLVLGCGSSLPTPWSKTEGREDVELTGTPGLPAGGGAGSAASSGTGETIDAAPVACEGELPTPTGEVVATLACGERVSGSSGKGARRLGDDFYQQAFCSPRRSRYDDAPEVIYRLELPPDTKAELSLESPCADLDLFAVAWQLPGVPGLEHVGRIRECEMDTRTGDGGKLTLTSVARPEVFLVGVDGKDGAEANYAISVSCGGYR